VKVAAGLWTTPTDSCKVLHAVKKSLLGSIHLSEARYSKEDAHRDQIEFYGSWLATTKDAGTYFSHGGPNDAGYSYVAMLIADVTRQRT
jgi:hypothetical protein